MSDLTLEQLKDDLQGRISDRENLVEQHNSFINKASEIKESITAHSGAISQLELLIERADPKDEDTEE
jgi:hypothetical protein|tara:strand:- start:17841 stop:18044 length:204 start_codon:yes stop_codon:yes gene_type:complete